MKVVFLNHETDLGGAEIMLLRFLRKCDRLRIEPVVVLPSEGKLADALEEAGIPIVKVPLTSRLLEIRRGDSLWNPRLIFDMTQALRQLRDTILNLEPKVIVSNSLKAHVYGSLALCRNALPYAWRLHDMIDRKHFGYFQHKFLISLARRSPVSIACVSEAAMEYLAESGVGEEKLMVLHNGIDVHRFAARDRIQASRRELGIDVDDFLITIVGRIMRSKGHSTLVNAMPGIVRGIPAARFLFAGGEFHGEPGYLEMIRNEIERIGLAGRVSFAGFRENVESVYAASDVVVQPSLEPDAFPTVILEAMASGCVVIASDSGGAREVLVDGKNGFLIPPGNSNALSRGVVELKQRNLSGIRLAARSTIEKHFNEESYVEKMTKWIEETGSGAMIARDSAQ